MSPDKLVFLVHVIYPACCRSASNVPFNPLLLIGRLHTIYEIFRLSSQKLPLAIDISTVNQNQNILVHFFLFIFYLISLRACVNDVRKIKIGKSKIKINV